MKTGHISVLTTNTKYFGSIGTSAHELGVYVIGRTGKARRRAWNTGKDCTRLGKCSWARFRVKNNVTLNFTLAYQCCSRPGPTTAFSQQRRFHDSIGESRNAKVSMCEELVMS